MDEEEVYCDYCEELDCDGGRDCAEWEPEYEDPHDVMEREMEAYEFQEMDRVGPDYWKDPDSGEMRLG